MKRKLDKPPPPRRTRPVLLKDEERYRLLYGPYEPPLVKRGFLVDAVRGKVRFGTFTNALIPWPKNKRTGNRGSGAIVLCGDLLRALESESIPAISHHWGVSRSTVGHWRRALELTRRTEFTPGAQRLVNLGLELARLPESRMKLAEAARGRVLSRARRHKLLAGIRRGWKDRFNARRAAFRRTGRYPRATKSDPWIPEEERLLPMLPTAELARVLGRTASSIEARRILLGIRTFPRAVGRSWTEREIKLVGTAADRVIAQRLGRPVSSVENKRRALGIKPLNTHLEVARKLGRVIGAVRMRRAKLHVPVFQSQARPVRAGGARDE